MFYNKRLIVLLTRTLYNESRIPAFAICGMPLWFGFRAGKARGLRCASFSGVSNIGSPMEERKRILGKLLKQLYI